VSLEVFGNDVTEDSPPFGMWRVSACTWRVSHTCINVYFVCIASKCWWPRTQRSGVWSPKRGILDHCFVWKFPVSARSSFF